MSKKIKTIKRYNQNYKLFGFTEGQPKAEVEFLESETVINSEGNVLSESKFDADGEPEEKNSYRYEAHGKPVEHILHLIAEDMTEKRIFNRDEKGRLLEEIKYYGDDTGERTTFVYDEKDNLVERKYFDEEGDFQAHETFSYNKDGSLLEHKKTNKEGKIEEHRSFINNDDRTIEQHEYNDDGSLSSKTIFKFDEAGKEISSIQTTADGKLISAVTTTYDDNGNEIEKQFKDFYSKTVRYSYDDNNRCLTNELFDVNGVLIRKNLYEYDEEGNVIAEQTYEMDTSRGGRDKHFGIRYEYEFY